MATFPNNILQQVQTYQRSGLGLLLNMACHINTSNKKFKDFDKIIAVYSDALDYYPDSEKLSMQLESVLRERQSIIFVNAIAKVNFERTRIM